MTSLQNLDLSQSFGNATHLVCRACGAKAQLGADYSCWECFGPLEVAYEFGQITREQIQSGPLSIWRYAPLLPVPANIAQHRNLAPGLTRLHRADNLAKALELPERFGLKMTAVIQPIRLKIELWL